MKVTELREKAKEEAQLARDIQDRADAEGRMLTEDEASDMQLHVAKARQYEQQADRQEELESLEGRLEAPEEPKTKPEITATGERIEVPGPKLHTPGTLRAFKGEKARINAYRSGRFLAATIFNHAPSRQWCREHGVEIRIDTDIDARAMSEGINTAGGFTVPDEFEQSIIDLREEYGNARRNLRIKQMATDHTNEPRKNSGLTAYPVGENTEITASDQGWGNVELTAKKWGVLVRISSELSEDTIINLADDIANDGALAFATSEDEACIDGDGTSTYHGIVGVRVLMIDGSHTGSYYDASSGCDEWSEVTDTILMRVMANLPKYARRGALWHCSPLAKVAVFDRLMSAKGGVTMRETIDGPYRPQYMGYPIEEWPAMPTDDTSAALNNKIMLMFGNLVQSSKMGVRRGITVKRLEERYAEFDQVGILMTERFTINHHTITGATSSDAGPIIGLLGGT